MCADMSEGNDEIALCARNVSAKNIMLKPGEVHRFAIPQDLGRLSLEAVDPEHRDPLSAPPREDWT